MNCLNLPITEPGTMSVHAKVITGYHGETCVKEEIRLPEATTLLQLRVLLHEAAHTGWTGLELWGNIAEGIYNPNRPNDVIRRLKLPELRLKRSKGFAVVPRHLLKTETRKEARKGPALLRTGEKITYVHGVGYLYSHSYSHDARASTMLAWRTGEQL